MRRITPHTDPLSDFTPMEPPPERLPPPWPVDCPEPGVYFGESYEWYAKIPAVNATALKAGVDLSPLHMREAIHGHRDDTTARRFGRAEHIRFLEPHAYAERILIAKPCSALLKSGERQGQPCGATAKYLAEDGNWYCGIRGHAPEVVTEPSDYIQQEEADRIERAWQSVCRHPVVKMLRAGGGCEVSLIWNREGIPCKARLDKLIPPDSLPMENDPSKMDPRAWILDLKKVQAWRIDATSIDRQISRYRYDLQAEWYCEGHEILTGTNTMFAWIFAEDNRPYDVRPKMATKSWRRRGKRLVDIAFGAYKLAMERNEWPGVSPDFDKEKCPDHYLKNLGLPT